MGEGVLIYAVNSALLPPHIPLQLNSESGPTNMLCIPGKVAVFPETLSSELGGRGSLAREERKISHCFNCCLGPRNLPAPVFCQGDPGPEVLPTCAVSRQGEMTLSTDSSEPSSTASYTLHPFSCLSFPTHFAINPRGKKARGSSCLLVVE